jgi:outer membrane protein assembly factor BamB
MILRRIAAGLIGTTFLFANAAAADWARFRGTNGNGEAEAGTPIQFNAKSDLVWKLKIPGVGHGSPIVVKDKVFLQTSTPDETGRLLMCINAKTGKEEWSKQVAGQKQKMHK